MPHRSHPHFPRADAKPLVDATVPASQDADENFQKDGRIGRVRS
jgi:hypothetical protein